MDGLIRFLAEVVPQLSREYHVSMVVPWLGKSEKKIACEHVEFIKTFPIQFADFKLPKFSFSKIKKLVDDSDLVFINDLGPIGLLCFRYARKFRKPVFAYTHVIEWEIMMKSLKAPLWLRRLLTEITRIVVRYIYNRVNVLMVPSENIAASFSANGVRCRKALVHLGVDSNKFKPQDKDEAKRRLGLEGKFVIGYTGRVSKEKDIDTLVEAFQKLKERNKDVELLIIGDGPDFMKENLKKNRIKVTGFVYDVENYLNALDVFVLPSLTETTSLATMEAMSCGLPVIVTNIGVPKEYIEPGINGLFFPRKNESILAEKIQKLINDPELRARLGSNARRTIEKHYTWDVTVKRILKVLKKF
jgi:glycosyltransferase involved in cell wall biosynthesis